MSEFDLGEGLLLRSVRDEGDRVRYVALTAAVNGRAEAAMGDRLLRHHPGMRGADFFFVEDTRSGEIVSTTCLIPWRCRLEGVEVKVAMLEMVGTRPAYRRRGLIRAQMERFHRAVDEGGYDLCIIQGIPYYYRQYGYGYAVDLWGYDTLLAERIPEAYARAGEEYRVREATDADLPSLGALYAAEADRLGFATLREKAYWRYLIGAAGWRVRVWESVRDGSVRGYACTVSDQDGAGLRVVEAGADGHETTRAILGTFKTEVGGASMRLNWPDTGSLVQVARSLGSTHTPPYQWLFRIPEVASWLRKLGPVLERRLAGSMHAGLTAELVVNLFRQAYGLRFEVGRLREVRCLGFVDASMNADGGDLCLPPDAFLRLSLGYRDLDEIHDAWPDTAVKPQRRHLLGVLFPKVRGYLAMPY